MSSARVLLLWPGTDGAAAGNFGVPQLVTLASYLKANTRAHVDIVDLVCERAFGPVSLSRVLGGPDGAGYDVIAIGCYSSFDYLKCQALAEIARRLHPRALICAGGYHVSARPADIVYDGSPFDVAIVGEGELPLTRVVESVAGGAPLSNAILGPEPLEDLDAQLPPSDWSLLDRYRPIARRVASQAQVYFSRGCPFDCAFCMERAKREVSWRAFSPARAVDELERLDAFLGLSDWTLYVADALFGMRKAWRREFLELCARSRVKTQKTWLLIRVDMVDEEDLRQFAAANCALGFGLESGDPGLLATIRKAGRLDDYLDRMREIAARSRELDVPWGANVIVGHPGETEETLRTSAKYLSELFLDPRGITGFLSVDPFRLYPGSPIDDERSAWEARFGTRFHRPTWWHDGDPEFLSEWVDPSHDLSYRRRAELTTELLGPVLAALPENFSYRGPARDYFVRALEEQRDNLAPRYRMHFIDRCYAWQKYLGRTVAANAARDADRELAEVARELRLGALPAAARAAGIPDERWSSSEMERIRRALEDVPRERFVPLDEIAASRRDEAIALDATGLASVSAFHAYVRAFDLAGVAEGDVVLDLGAGTGYGAALLARIVGPRGRVVAVEIDPALAARATTLLASEPHAEVVAGDAFDPKSFAGVRPARVVVGFAVEAIPESWAAALDPGTVVVVPIVRGETQVLCRAVLVDGAFAVSSFEEVRYVGARASAPEPPPAAASTQQATEGRATRRLPLVAAQR